MNNSVNEIAKALQKFDNFIVSSHVSPDGDNLGSSVAVINFLKNLGKKVTYVLDDVVPANLKFITEGVKKCESSDIINSDLKKYTLISLDCGDIYRIALDKKIVENVKNHINIDHHITNNGFGNYNYVKPEESSTCEIVYNVLKQYEKINESKVITVEIATALYLGLVTDTGCFQYSNVRPSSFKMAEELLEIGAQKNDIITRIYQSSKLNYYKVLGDALENLEVYYDGKVAVTYLTLEMLLKHGVKYDEIDPIVTYTRDIEGVEVGIFIKEKNKGEFKISIRSKEKADVSLFAQEFNGGGHKRASGCTINVSDVQEAKAMLISKIKDYI